MAESMYEVLPVAFYFQVEFQGEPSIEQIAFKEVSGLSVEIELESVAEGGSNEYEIKLPKQGKHGNLMLKRAIMPANDNLGKWVKNCLEGGFREPIQPRTVIVKLINELGKTLYIWNCANAWPVKWDTESFDSEKNSVAIESLELTYTTIKRSDQKNT